MARDLLWEQEFNQCRTLQDFENYLRKYYGVADNPYLAEAKKKVVILSKQKTNVKLANKSLPILFLGFVVSLAAAVGLLMLSLTQEGQSSSTVYHGEYGDYHHSNLSVFFLGFLPLICAVALFGVSIYFLYLFIIQMAKNKKR